MPTDIDVLVRLRQALDGLAFALELGEPDAVLAAESPLRTAVNDLRASDLAALATEPAVRPAVLNVQLALSRCRALGGSAAVLASVMSGPGYGRTGLRARPRVPVSTLESQI